MDAAQLHNDSIVFDGLVVSKWGKDIFEDMRRGGITAANCTCSVWENFRDSMDNIASFKRWFDEYDHLLMQVRCTEDIRRAKDAGKVGICLGWQNTTGIEDRVNYLELFHELGVGIMQMTYNTQNFVGSGCYESDDGGLSDFGKEVVSEMNRLGILCDLSHVGPNTSRDVIKHSSKPVAYSHILPAALKEHQRNKSDEQLKFIVDHGGFVGVTIFAAFLKSGVDSTIDDVVEAFEHVIDLVGEDRVGIGTDFIQGHGPDFFHWITHDKGYGRKLIDVGSVYTPRGLECLGDLPNLTAAFVNAGWSESRIRKVLGQNWVDLLKEVWGS
ncbi:MAG: membrane dipeptidase [Lentisphaerae bacterium]|nr:membrane dipeptidase [Lentisphaerota bacterium]